MMEYHESLAYLRELTKFGFNFGLDRVKELLRRLGNPEKTMTYIHVGGTNGKGSITAMLNAMLIAAGEKPGMFTSPHLHSYRERFQIGGEMISHEDVVAILNEIKPHIDAMIAVGFEQPTEFEVNTVMAFLYFAKKGVQTVVLEVGMGGEIDATNVIEKVKVAVLVNVALEHTEYLGDTKEKICLTKAGIIKKDCHFVSGCLEPELQELLKSCAAKAEVLDVSFLQQDFDFAFEAESADLQTFTYRDREVVYDHLELPLRGRHQLGNAAVALRAARLFGLGEAAIREGLLKTSWPCRLEKVADNPLTLIDGAHNDHGMAVLTSYLKDHYADKSIVVLIGMLADKEREKAVALLGPLVKKVVVTKPNSPRAGDFQLIADFFKPYCSEIYLEADIPRACGLAQNLAKDLGSDGLLLITGSLYMVADARGYLLGIESE
ncbi:MAG TPA: folylpolyglutamate synthase/dihydrofolate synthase family protein [Clostridiales bacterium]|nr:folylpolyglutamate synthase/dihydrofolate synthase family protein [Clostridiales bacterium]